MKASFDLNPSLPKIVHNLRSLVLENVKHGPAMISLAVLIFLILTPACNQRPRSTWETLDLMDSTGLIHHPHLSTNALAHVFVFLSNDCPIANRSVPELLRLHQEFSRQQIQFWWVHSNPDETVASIRQHTVDFKLPETVIVDSNQFLAEFLGATITPEVFVHDTLGSLLYRGRIDDRAVALGQERPVGFALFMAILVSWFVFRFGRSRRRCAGLRREISRALLP